MSWSPILQSGFEPPALVKPYLYTDPPIAGWSENDVGPGTLEVVNTFARSGSQSMHSVAVAGESMAAEIYRNPALRGFRISAWLYYKAGTNFDRVIIWFQNQAQTLQFLRVRPKSYGVLEIAADSKLSGFPSASPSVTIPTGQWLKLEAWLLMSSSEKDGGAQSYQEAGVALNDVQLYKATSGFPTVDNALYGYLNSVEIGPWGVGAGPTEVWVDDVIISQYVTGPQHRLSMDSTPRGVPYVRRVV